MTKKKVAAKRQTAKVALVAQQCAWLHEAIAEGDVERALGNIAVVLATDATSIETVSLGNLLYETYCRWHRELNATPDPNVIDMLAWLKDRVRQHEESGRA